MTASSLALAFVVCRPGTWTSRKETTAVLQQCQWRRNAKKSLATNSRGMRTTNSTTTMPATSNHDLQTITTLSSSSSLFGMATPTTSQEEAVVVSNSQDQILSPILWNGLEDDDNHYNYNMTLTRLEMDHHWTRQQQEQEQKDHQPMESWYNHWNDRNSKNNILFNNGTIHNNHGVPFSIPSSSPDILFMATVVANRLGRVWLQKAQRRLQNPTDSSRAPPVPDPSTSTTTTSPSSTTHPLIPIVPPGPMIYPETVHPIIILDSNSVSSANGASIHQQQQQPPPNPPLPAKMIHFTIFSSPVTKKKSMPSARQRLARQRAQQLQENMNQNDNQNNSNNNQNNNNSTATTIKNLRWFRKLVQKQVFQSQYIYNQNHDGAATGTRRNNKPKGKKVCRQEETKLPTPFFNRTEQLHVRLTFRYSRPEHHFLGTNNNTTTGQDTNTKTTIAATSSSTRSRLVDPQYAQEPVIHENGIGDVDNLAKFVMDSLKDVLYPDDRQVITLSSVKLWSDDEHSNGSTTIAIWSAPLQSQ